MRNLKAIASSIAVPGVRLVATDEPSRSHFGGTPNLPPGFQWPEWHERKLGFLARISLTDLHRTRQIDWLPNEGALLFFYDFEEQPWGFDPKDRGGCAVVLVPDLDNPIAKPTVGAADDGLKYVGINFCVVQTLPSTDRPEVEAISLSDEEQETYWNLLDSESEGQPKHRIGGFPSPVQGDHMELECQLVSNGLYCGNSSGYNDPRASELEAGARDWRLLLQFDTDDDLEVMWGDCGTLYFWVRAQESTAGRFENSWLILQCS
ncbi:MAG: YwqG family protein [Propionivibrio sp.]